ncbi:MAG: hypothetical protein M3314_07765 [Actinomycetota bacterium]|nr:hypothetical protein [Actinomycetota bacterium]
MADVGGTPTDGRKREAAVYRSLVLLLATLYAIAAVLPDALRDRFPALAAMLFGFDQLKPLGWFAFLLPLLVVFVLRLPSDSIAEPVDRLLARVAGVSSRTRVLLALIAATYSFTWFLGLRNQFINPDGMAFSVKFHADLPVRGATVSHDEIFELYLHSRFWHHTNRAFGWTVEYSYQFLSSLAGAIFVVLLLTFAWVALHEKRWIVLVLGVGSAGFMQLFFGDVENYTLVTTLILLYLVTGYLYLEDRISLLVPSGVLAVAVTFHLLAAFLLLSLAYLYFVALRRRQLLSVALAAVILLAIPSAVVLYFHDHGLPFEVIRTSNAFGQAGKLQRFAAPSLEYHSQIVSLVFLLFPPVLCLIPLLAYRRVDLTRFNIFMALAVAVFIAYVFTWRADLGVYNDWNLYAPAALPLAIFFWYNLARADALVNKAGIVAALILTSGVHSYAWIIRNHV